MGTGGWIAVGVLVAAGLLIVAIYNRLVTRARRETFPDVAFAGTFGFRAAELLQATESVEERKAPKVSFQ